MAELKTETKEMVEALVAKDIGLADATADMFMSMIHVLRAQGALRDVTPVVDRVNFCRDEYGKHLQAVSLSRSEASEATDQLPGQETFDSRDVARFQYGHRMASTLLEMLEKRR